MAYAVWSPTQDQQNQWRSQAQALGVRSTSPNAGATGAAGNTGLFGGQATTAPTYYGTGGAWDTPRAAAQPRSAISSAIGGQLQDVYSTNPVGPNGYPTTNDTPRQPPPPRPTTQLPPVSTNPVGPTTPPTWPDRSIPPGQPGFDLGQWAPPSLNIPGAQRPDGGYAYPIPPMTPNGMFPNGAQPTAEWLADPTNQYILNTYLPWAQMDFDRYMAGQNFNQAAYQDDRNYGRQVALDQYNTALQSRQQQAAEWQAAEAARQWAEQFGYTQQRDSQEFQLANDQLAVERAYRQGLITNEQRNLALQELTQRQNNELGQGQLQLSRDELAALQQWRNTDAGLRQQELDNNLMASRYAAFGRSQAPSFGKWYRNWG